MSVFNNLVYKFFAMEKKKLLQLYNCSLCFKDRTASAQIVKLTKTIEGWFFDITQMEIKKSIGEPQQVCLDCLRDLRFCIEFKTLMITNQKNVERLQSCAEKEVQAIDADSEIESEQASREEALVKIEYFEATIESLEDDCGRNLSQTQDDQKEAL